VNVERGIYDRARSLLNVHFAASPSRLRVFA
jgi:hypothetical protein